MLHNDYDIRPLAAAIVLHAIREAKQGDQGARAWLQHDGLVFMDVCGVTLEPVQIKRWITRGCKTPSRGALQLGRDLTNTRRQPYTAQDARRSFERMQSGPANPYA